MSIPRTNLEDLRRKAESATPPVSSQSRSRDNVSTNKSFKFKASTGPAQPSGKLVSTAVTKDVSLTKSSACYSTKTGSFSASPTGDIELIGPSSVPIPSPTLSTSACIIPTKRLSSPTRPPSGSSPKRHKKEQSPRKKAFDGFVPKSNIIECPRPPPPSSSSLFHTSNNVPKELIADYEHLSLDALQKMLTTNMGARMDTIEKLLRVYRGEEGLDRAMLQEISDNLDKRIQAIKSVMESREGKSLSSNSQPTSSRTLGNIASPLSPIIPQRKTPDAPSTGTTINTPRHLKAIDYSDDEEALWAQLDDASVVPSPLRSIGNTLTTQPREPFKTMDVLSKGVNQCSDASTPFHAEIMQRLRHDFGLDSFRPNQLEAITATLSGKDVFVLMPTGGGKSLCYQVPAVCEKGKTKGVTVVVSPLIALMIDQVHHLKQRGIDAILFNSDQGLDSSREARAKLVGRGSRPKLLYVTPEKLDKSGDMRSILARLYRDGDLARFVIDEAHCVSTWGRDFRDAYQGLDRLRQDYPNVPIMALTATANEQVMKDVIDRLGIRDCVLLSQSFNRPNLHYDVRQKGRNVLSDINEFIQTNYKGQTGIIYCLSRNKCEEVAKELREKYGLRARHYHALMSPEDKTRAQTAWQKNECEIIVATIAFGMGIDKPDVRYVIHHSLPMSLDGYYQETGRAGRDGRHATCVLYYSYMDTMVLKKIIQDGEKTQEERKRQEDGVRAVVQYCQNDSDCRRVQVLGYFGQNFDREDCNNMCNNCLELTDHIEEDVTDMGVKAIQLVKELLSYEGNFTKLYCLDVFRGANLKAIRDRGHDRISMYGVGSSLPRERGERIFDHLIQKDGLEFVTITNKSGWNAAYLKLGKTANDFLSGRLRLILRTRIVNDHAETTLSSKEKATSTKAKPLTRSKSSVISTNRHTEDIFCDDEPSSNRSSKLYMEDIYDFGSSPLASPIKPRSQNQKQGTADVEILISSSKHCYNELVQRTKKTGAGSLPSDIDDSILQHISLILPTDHASLKEILREYMPLSEADVFYNSYGRTILQLCTSCKMSASTNDSTKLDVKGLHARYDFNPEQIPRRH